MAARNRKPSATAIRRYAKALRICLDDERLDPAFKSLMLSVPGETDLASFIGENVDPQRLHDARNAVRAMTGQALYDRLIEVLGSGETQAAYSPDSASTAWRSLQHSALSLVAAADTAEGARLAVEQFRGAGHMTDKANALSVLSLLDTPEREEALGAFFDDYRDDHLVVDKWLSLNAQWPFEGCASKIESLMQHSCFSLTRPNRVRALIGAFASSNMSQFAAADGSGFDLVGRVIVDLDAINPQVAARMAASFKSWRVLEPRRRNLAEKTLKMIVSSKDLSRDTFEIVSKSLK